MYRYSSKVAYTMAMVGFAVITGYMIFAASELRTERWEQILCTNHRALQFGWP
jgi:hypothetical protein